MIKENKAEFDKSNLTKWHEAGYKGQNVTILILDDKGLPFDYTNVETPFRGFHKNDTDHNTYMCAVAREGASKVRIITIPWNGMTTPNRKVAIDWIEKHKEEIDIISCSWGGTIGKEEFERLKSFDIPILCATGNGYSEDRIHRPASYDYTIAVGAATESKNHVTPASNGGPEIDIVAYTNIYITKVDGSIMSITDTSGATIFASSMLACYLSWRKEKGLPRLGREEIRQFLHDNSIDLYEEGHDYKSGYGLFILPNKIPKVESKPIEPIEEEKPKEDINMSNKFTDTKGHWAEGAIDYVADKGLMKGYEEGQPGPQDDTFKPDAPITRAELATVLARQNGYVEPPKK